MPIDFAGFAYAATVAAGGIVGYMKSGSIPSLGAGLLFGSILGYGAFQTSQDPNNYRVLLGTSVTLGGMMGYRFYMSRKLMPAGVITIISTAMVITILVRQFSAPIPVSKST